jgi:manganese/zinc/iron transport system substrate-binding protein
VSRRALASVLAVVAAALGAAGCGAVEQDGGSAAAAEGRLRVVTTTNWITDTAKQIGGDRVQVDGLMGAGVDPHLYRASAGDVDTLRDADVAFYNGLNLEARMEEVFDNIARERVVVAVGEAVPADRLLPAGDGTDEFDPHVWFDPERWAFVARAMAQAYTEADPEGAADYEANLERFIGELDELRAYADERFDAIPSTSRVLVTSHDAFGYFGEAFDFEVVAIQGLSTADEATTGDIERVAQVIARRELRSVFVESSVPRQTIEAVLAAARRVSGGRDVQVGGELFGDNAGDVGTPGGTYVGALRQNIDLIADGLS